MFHGLRNYRNEFSNWMKQSICQRIANRYLQHFLWHPQLLVGTLLVTSTFITRVIKESDFCPPRLICFDTRVTIIVITRHANLRCHTTSILYICFSSPSQCLPQYSSGVSYFPIYKQHTFLLHVVKHVLALQRQHLKNKCKQHFDSITLNNNCTLEVKYGKRGNCY